MHVLNFLGNVLWFLLGGLVMGLAWWLVGVLCFISIIGIPWGRACFVIGKFAFCPFGKMPVSREVLTGQPDVGTGFWGMVGNVIWFVLAGVWIALAHLAWAAACAVTIIGIPFAWQHVKLAALALCPIGKTIVPAQVAEAAEQRAAQERAAREQAAAAARQAPPPTDGQR
ncbi:YccF domain-containing protein [Desulfovibrio sp.]|uniref:YccF domain-containing protein n=1 Tax=Desulfovibrio sp. TaxID=885 RepID=UPI0025B860FC|nr:YccF domain-containing protein [Desulfovibrio sp.]